MTNTGPDQQWRQLVAAAVLGVDRAGARLPAIDGAPARLLPATVEGPGGLLRYAAVLPVYERAGRRPGAASGPVLACEADPTAPCSFQSGQHLARILLADFGFLFDEWCALAARRGVRAPDELLPAILDRLAASKEGIDERSAAVLGQRGLWLAGLNPAWRGIAGSNSNGIEEVWKAGDKAQRLGLIRRLRQSEPRKARELLASTWAQEDGDDRAAFIPLLAQSLSPEDEAFLEATLDDGRKPVRQAAAELLARLPDSAFCKRMRARAAACVSLSLKKGLLRGSKLKIDATLPDKVEKPLLRDGIENKRSGAMGEKAHALSQIIAATPLGLWEESGATPEEILAAVEKSDWHEPLVRGWTRAAIRQSSIAPSYPGLNSEDGEHRLPGGAVGISQRRDADGPRTMTLSTQWADALVRIGLETKEGFDFEQLGELIGALDVARRERIMTEVLRGDAVEPSPGLALLEFCRQDWSDAFSRKALAAMRGFFGSPKSYSAHDLRNTLKQTIVRYLSPNVAADVEKGWNRTSGHWHRGDEDFVTTMAATLAFRRAMHEEFAK